MQYSKLGTIHLKYKWEVVFWKPHVCNPTCFQGKKRDQGKRKLESGRKFLRFQSIKTTYNARQELVMVHNYWLLQGGLLIKTLMDVIRSKLRQKLVWITRKDNTFKSCWHFRRQKANAKRTVTCHFVLRHFNRCNFNRSHFQPLAFSTACKFNRHKFDLFN